MNKAQIERQRRFAAMRNKKVLEDGMQRADVVKCLTPGGPALGSRDKNMHIKCMFEDVVGHGHYNVEHWRDGKHIASYTAKNGITNEGLNDILDVMFDAGDQKTAWYMCLINLSGFTALAAADNYDNINQAGNGWDTFESYTDANNGGSAVTRPEWPAGTPSGQSITNATQAIFDITASGTVKGIYVVAGENAQTKGNHAPGTTPPNKLWSTALFSGGDVVVQNGDQLKVTYTVNASTA